MTQPNDAAVERVKAAIWDAVGQRLISFVGTSTEAGDRVSWQQWKEHAEAYPYSLGHTLEPFDIIARAALEAAGSESTPIVAETEARIVEWLREMAAMPADAGFNSAGKTRSQILTMLADSIARRDHVTGEKDRG